MNRSLRVILLAPIEVILTTLLGAWDGFVEGLDSVRMAWIERHRIY